MDSVTTTPARICQHTELHERTPPGTTFVDLTDRLAAMVADSGIGLGTLCVQTMHTTTALVVNEHEPLLLADFTDLLERMAPRERSYWHDEIVLRDGVPADEPRNGHAHCRALLLPVSACLTIVHGHLRLGRWQRVFLVELDGPRERTVSVVITGEAAL